MGSIGNQYSFIIAAAAIFIVAAIALLSRKPRWQEFLSLGVIGAGLIAAWVVLHPVQTPLMENAQKVRDMIGHGQPVLLEFQSPYCISCTQSKPVVDKIENDNKGRLLVIRLNVQEQVGRELAALYGFNFTPTFIFFDAQGNELWRSIGEIDPDQVRQSLE